MDQSALVDRTIDDGQKLVLQLARDGFDLTAAFWLKTTEDNWWHLYVASKVVDETGPAGAYRAVQVSLQRLPGTTISLGDVKLIGAGHPLAREVVRILKRSPVRTPARQWGVLLDGVVAEEIYIYPPPLREKRTGLDWEKRRLKTAVQQTSRLDELVAPLTPRERQALERLVASGISPTQADYWIREKREAEHDKPSIPPGTVVKARLAAWWGDRPEDDPNPLLLVEAPDGAQGLTFKERTEPVD
jgi:hypothetical protein